jgi:endonuclease-3
MPVPNSPKRRSPSPKRITNPKPRSAAEIHEIFSRFRQQRPEPKGELDYINPFTLLVAVVLSAQATDAGVNKATRGCSPSPIRLKRCSPSARRRCANYIKTIGLYRNKAKNVIALCEKLITEFGSEVPTAREALESLPGRRPQDRECRAQHGLRRDHAWQSTRMSSASPTACASRPARMCCRLSSAWIRGPGRVLRHAHHWLILHGRYTCKAQRPACETCVVADLCDSADKRVA